MDNFSATPLPAPASDAPIAAPLSACFDEHGRCQPEGIDGAHQRTRRHFVCSQPAINYPEIHARIGRQLDAPGTPALTAHAFEQRAEAILARLRADPQTAAITLGAHVPFYLPQAVHDDIGQALDARYLPAVGAAFQSRFPDYSFVNHHKAGLSGKLSIARDSRHQRLLQAMAGETVVGYYFPCLLEYSLPAARQQVQEMPEHFLLAGGFDTCAAFIGSPDLLLKHDAYPPLLWLSALEAEQPGIGYHFEAYGYNLTFNRRAHLGQVAEYWASGLVVLG
jgi:hypothetical protein